MQPPSEAGFGRRAAWVCRPRPWLAAHIVVKVVTRSFLFMMKRETPALFGVFWKKREKEREREKRGRDREDESEKGEREKEM